MHWLGGTTLELLPGLDLLLFVIALVAGIPVNPGRGFFSGFCSSFPSFWLWSRSPFLLDATLFPICPVWLEEFEQDLSAEPN